MLNRYGLFDIDKFLREQDAPLTAGEDQPAGAAGTDAAPPSPTEPDEKIDQARQKNSAADLVDFRKQHAGAIYRVGQSLSSGPQNFESSGELRDLQQRFEDSGVDEPFFILFDPETTGISGPRHIKLIASLLHNGVLRGNRVQFNSAGDASLFAEKAPGIRDDLSFAVDAQDRNSVQIGPVNQGQTPTQGA